MAFYDAFISYSHAKDKPIAARLQSTIQKLGKPWYRRRALRLFRDDTSLSGLVGAGAGGVDALWRAHGTIAGEHVRTCECRAIAGNPCRS